MTHCCRPIPPPRSRVVADSAKFTTVLSRKAAIDTITATTMTRLVGTAARILTSIPTA